MNKSEDMVIYECGICGAYHPWDFNGDCRDDDNRFSPDEYANRIGVSEDDLDIRDFNDRLGADVVFDPMLRDRDMIREDAKELEVEVKASIRKLLVWLAGFEESKLYEDYRDIDDFTDADWNAVMNVLTRFVAN